jgi:hypothetical protein
MGCKPLDYVNGGGEEDGRFAGASADEAGLRHDGGEQKN